MFVTLFFLVTSFIIITWSLGYRLDVKSYTFSKTGDLSLKTDKASFDIFIDNKKIFSKNNKYLIESLLPKDYLVKIEKDGFWNWSKNLTIEPQKVTREEHIVLFPKSLRAKDLSADAVNYKITENNSFIIAQNNNAENLQKIDIKNNKPIDEIKINDISSFEPDFEGNNVLIKQKEPENKPLT